MEFAPGDEAMLVCPAGSPPHPEGPVRVIGCIYFDEPTGVSAYVVQWENGRLEPVDGVELVHLASWATWMQQYAN